MASTTAGTTQVSLGQALRTTRERREMSLRELARRVNVSPSFVSQIELGKANPSVGTLYALVTALGITLDDLLGDQTGAAGPASDGAPAAEGGSPGSWPRVDEPVQPAEGRKRVEMSGVAWERLTHDHDPYVDFLHVEYAPGSSSCAPEQMMRHGGREYGHVVSGRLDVQVGFDSYSLGPGDSIHFDSMTPHRLSNPYDEACRAVWFVLARSDDDRISGLE
ncbi:helix-turn-helix domain-containing protein [Nocardioides sp.]|uniref:helix-turn-helix domain-containing protein n=1 Tax=Nocardioides sp. TaxID=35761 RepID=UPI002ED10A63